MHPFTTFDDLAGALNELLPGGHFDAVIHLAAVSDYDVDHVVVDGTSVTVDTNSKLDTGDVMEIHLKRNPKLLAQLKDLGGDDLVVVGFKLTNGASAEQRAASVRGIVDGTDLVVHNDVTEMGEGRHVATIYRPVSDSVEVVATVADNAELAAVLEREIAALRCGALSPEYSTAQQGEPLGDVRLSHMRPRRLDDLGTHGRCLGRVHRVAEHHGEIVGRRLERDRRDPPGA